MKLLHNAPVRRKLMLLAMTCSTVALVATALALGIYEWFGYRRSLVAQLTTMTSIAAQNL